ncbi:small acid-soluble spore protein Tlp [Lysinibacillus sp. LZ02]|uniref:small acid-soluble spore protein Tlp n=1 Tax=Lysinibacillus sp. LZ02 TaxID=3420668 RepID=UPI003D362B05
MSNKYQAKPDDRTNNVERLQSMVKNTMENMEAAEETMLYASPEERAQIEAKNKRREQSVTAMQEEIQDEKAAREQGYQ